LFSLLLLAWRVNACRKTALPNQAKHQISKHILDQKERSEMFSEKPPKRSDVTLPLAELAAQAAAQTRRMLSAGESRQAILSLLVNTAETVAGEGGVCSILELDNEGLLRNAASPNLPADYLEAIDKLKPNPGVGTCAAAAATGSVVVTCDFMADDKWAELRHLPLSLGFVGAWSMPIKNNDGKVLGTLGTYFRDRRTPTPEEMASVETLASAASLVLGPSDQP